MSNYIFSKNIVTVGPLGYCRASGTLGTLVGFSLIFLIRLLSFTPMAYTLVTLGISIGALICIYCSYQFFSDADPKEIIIDEVVGSFIACYGISFNLYTSISCFVLFRFFDISKCCGIKFIEKKITGAWGIMLDDIIAGLFTNILIRIVLHV